MKNVTFIEGFSETLSVDRLRKDVYGERLSIGELLSPAKVKRIPVEQAIVLAKRKERKKQKYLAKIGVSHSPGVMNRCVSTKDLLTTVGKKTKHS